MKTTPTAIQRNRAAALEPPGRQLPTVGIVACAGFGSFQLSTPLAIFSSSLSGFPLFETRLCGVEGRTLRNESGMVLDAPFGLEGLTDADLIVVPFWRSPDERPPRELLRILRDAHSRGATVVGLCLGGYVLAYAGLLDHRGAATHQDLTDDFKRRFPKVRLDPDAVYVETDNLITSAGMGAAIDCCLSVVRSIYGSTAANQIAQQMAVPLHLEGRTAPFAGAPEQDTPEVARLKNSLDYVADNLSAQHSVNTLAARAGMSRRSFTRYFNKATGMSVGKWLLSKRLQEAQFLLETTKHRIEAVAYLVGFPSVVSFRRRFRAELGSSPNNWRRSRSEEVSPKQASAVPIQLAPKS